MIYLIKIKNGSHPRAFKHKEKQGRLNRYALSYRNQI